MFKVFIARANIKKFNELIPRRTGALLCIFKLVSFPRCCNRALFAPRGGAHVLRLGRSPTAAVQECTALASNCLGSLGDCPRVSAIGCISRHGAVSFIHELATHSCWLAAESRVQLFLEHEPPDDLGV